MRDEGDVDALIERYLNLVETILEAVMPYLQRGGEEGVGQVVEPLREMLHACEGELETPPEVAGDEEVLKAFYNP